MLKKNGTSSNPLLTKSEQSGELSIKIAPGAHAHAERLCDIISVSPCSELTCISGSHPHPYPG